MPSQSPGKPVAKITSTAGRKCVEIYDPNVRVLIVGPLILAGPVQPKPPRYFQRLLKIRRTTWLICGLAGAVLSAVAKFVVWTSIP